MKRILLFLMVMGMTGKVMAQSGPGAFRAVRLGFNIDPGIYMLHPQESGVNRTAAKAGLKFGLMADFMLNEEGNYAIASGFQVVLAGSKLKYDANRGLDDYKAAPAEYNMKLKYVEVPVTLKLKSNPTAQGIAFWGQFGSYVAFPVGGRADIISRDQTFDRVNIMTKINRINVGMLIGAGIEYPLGDRLTALAGISYQNGFVDVTRNAKWDDGKVNMNSFALRLGIYF